MTWVNNLTPTVTTSEFRYEVYSNNPLDIDDTRQVYYLELSATISTADMDPPFAKTQQIQLIVENGCLNDQITNSGDYDGVYTVANGSIPDNVATEYVYYINEDTEAPSFTQDATGTGPGWIRQWKTSWSQTVHGCPVQYKIFITRDLSDSTRIANSHWGALKTTAMVHATYQSEAWYSPLSADEKLLLEALRTAQTTQGDMNGLTPGVYEGNLASDYDASTAEFGSNFYESVIYSSDTQAQVFSFGTQTWWE